MLIVLGDCDENITGSSVKKPSEANPNLVTTRRGGYRRGRSGEKEWFRTERLSTRKVTVSEVVFKGVQIDCRESYKTEPPRSPYST